MSDVEIDQRLLSTKVQRKVRLVPMGSRAERIVLDHGDVVGLVRHDVDNPFRPGKCFMVCDRHAGNLLDVSWASWFGEDEARFEELPVSP